MLRCGVPWPTPFIAWAAAILAPFWADPIEILLSLVSFFLDDLTEERRPELDILRLYLLEFFLC